MCIYIYIHGEINQNKFLITTIISWRSFDLSVIKFNFELIFINKLGFLHNCYLFSKIRVFYTNNVCIGNHKKSLMSPCQKYWLEIM